MAGQDFRSSRLWRIFRPFLPTLWVSLTDDAGNPESVTSAATEAVAAIPMTAELQDLPSGHNGAGAFTFRIAFSEGMAISDKDFRDHSLTGTKKMTPKEASR